MQDTKEQLIGHLVLDPTYNTTLRITGFRRDGKVSLNDDETGIPSVMTVADLTALENAGEALGKIDRSDRATCPLCEELLVAGHEHGWLDPFDITDITHNRQDLVDVREDIVRFSAAVTRARLLDRLGVAEAYAFRLAQAKHRAAELTGDAA